MIDQDVRQAIKLARQGDKARAQELLKQALKRDPNNVDAWVVLAQVIESRDEAISYMKRAVKLRPDDERARRYLDYLLQQEPSLQPQPTDKAGPSNATIVALAVVALVLCLGLVLAYAFLRPGAQQAQPTNAPLNCEALVAQALELSDQGCQGIGRNEVCYGHSTIQAQLAPGSTAQFNSMGDKVGLDMLEKFVASPLNLEKQEWGIGVFKVEANVPGSLPGQAVTLLIFGSSVDNASGDMQAFYFSSGLGSIVCENVPFDGILVRMPDGTGISFSANGADITLMGTGVLQAQPGQDMSVSMLSGIGKVAAGGQEQSFGPGQEVTVPLQGLEASGPPSDPVTAIQDVLTMACTLTGIGCPGTAIPTVSQADVQSTLAAIPEATAVAEATTEPSDTPPSDEPTIRPGETPPPIVTQRPGEPTWTPAPTETPTKTNTPGGPTNTPVTPTKTYTPGGPTVTPVKPTTPPPTTPPPTTPPPTTPPPTTPPPTTPPPTTPPPTTPPPTTPPPTTDPCTLINLSWGIINKKDVPINIANNTGAVVTLAGVTISWTSSTNGNLAKLTLDKSPIWSSGTSLPSPATPTPLTGTLTIPSGGNPPLTFGFEKDADPASGYSITLTFQGMTCTPPIGISK